MVFHLVHSCVFNVAIVRLMIATMGKYRVSPVGAENVLGVLPLVASIIGGKDSELPVAILSIIGSLILFYGHIYLLGQ